MRKRVGIIKRASVLLLVALMSINSFAAIVSDNDGSAFITKSEFDALKSSFQSQIDSYNNSIDSKIDGAIASYLAGIKLSSVFTTAPLYNYDGYNFIDYPTPTKNDLALWGVTGWVNDPAFNPWPSGFRANFQNAAYTMTCGWVCQSAENRWNTSQQQAMKAVYDMNQEKAAMRSGYYFQVDDRTNTKQYINSINYLKAKIEKYTWASTAGGGEFIFHRNNSQSVSMGTAREWAVTYPTGIDLKCFPANNIGEPVVWQIRMGVKKPSGGSATYDYYIRMPFENCALDEVYTDFSNSSFGFLTTNPTDFSLVLCDYINGPDLKTVSATWNYAVAGEEGNTLVDLGYGHTHEGGKFYTGQKIVGTANINVFNKDNAKSFKTLYSNKIHKETKEDVELYAGVPFLMSSETGIAKMQILGQAASVDFLIKDSKFTGWTKSADSGAAITIKDDSGAVVTKTPSNYNTITITFPVEKNKTYYYKLGIGGGIKITSEIEITKEN